MTGEVKKTPGGNTVGRSTSRLAILLAILVVGGCTWFPAGFDSNPDAAAVVESQVNRFLAADALKDSSLYQASLAPEFSIQGQVAGITASDGVIERDAFIEAVENNVWPSFGSLENFVEDRTVTIDGDTAIVAGKYHREIELLPGVTFTIHGTIVFELKQVQDTWVITGISLDTNFDHPSPGDGGDTDPVDPDPDPDPEPDPDPDPDPEPKPDLVIETGWIRPDSSNFRTPYYVLTSSKPGPTLMVVGGVHGNEIAGYQAAERIVSELAPDRGRVVVIPRANARAVALNQRGAPDLTDLNRRFPTGSSPVGLTANDIWNVVVKYKPDWFLDLHEGYDFHIVNKNSVGQSVIVYPTGNSTSVARSLVNHLNAMPAVTRNGSKRFSYLQYPVAGSLARKVGADLRIPAAIIETAWPDPLARRVGFHLQAVRYVAERMGMKLIDQPGLNIEKRAI